MAGRLCQVAVTVLLFGHAWAAPEDASVLVQRSVASHASGSGQGPGHAFKLGERVSVEGYGDKVATIVGFFGGPERYNVNILGVAGVKIDVDGRLLHSLGGPYPRLKDKEAGPIASIIDLEYEKGVRPYIVSRGQKPFTWNVYIPKHGLVENLPAGMVRFEKSWYKTSSTTTPAPSKWDLMSGRVTTVAPKATAAPKLVMPLKLTIPTIPPALVSFARETELAGVRESAKREQREARYRQIEEEMQAAVKQKRGRKAISLELLGQGLGFTTQQSQGEGLSAHSELMLLVESLGKEGPAARWNQAHPRHPLRRGDRILQVDGMGGNPQRLENELLGIPDQDPNATVHLLVERPSLTTGEGLQSLVGGAKELMEKGPMGIVRDALPFDIGKELINAKDTVTACGDISSSLLCSRSQQQFGVTCAGWTGSQCVAAEGLECTAISNEGICKNSEKRLNITCAGWGGSTCVPLGGSAEQISDMETCNRAQEKLGIEVAGWGGSSCLAKGAQCKEITLPGLCNMAQSKLGLSCLGWGGDNCLDHGAPASLITNEFICHHSQELLGIESAGWSGSSCLPKEDAKCSLITEPEICAHSQKRLGVDCAGWGGSSCLEPGAEPSLITEPSICARSKQALGIESGGWSGSLCLPPGTPKCSDITLPGICNDASRRLNIDCLGWVGEVCLAPGELKCGSITTKGLCGRASARFGVDCLWNGDLCLPDTAATAQV